MNLARVGDRFFEDLARTLATPMPRRRVLRLIGGVIVAGLVPGGLRPRGAWGRASVNCAAKPDTPFKCACPNGNTGLNFEACCWSGAACHCDPRAALCCPRPTVWEGGKCAKPCLGARCGKKCCPDGQRCQNPRTETCAKCPRGTEECGTKCCPKKTKFCCTHDRGGICCDKKVCCVNPGESDSYCCPVDKPNCGKQILPGEDGLRENADILCCPDDRYVEDFRACCSSGEKALKRGPAVDFSGRMWCCPEAAICKQPRGPALCCMHNMKGEFADLNQICCGSKCVNYMTDTENCGGCGVDCVPGEECVMGVCK